MKDKRIHSGRASISMRERYGRARAQANKAPTRVFPPEDEEVLRVEWSMILTVRFVDIRESPRTIDSSSSGRTTAESLIDNVGRARRYTLAEILIRALRSARRETMNSLRAKVEKGKRGERAREVAVRCCCRCSSRARSLLVVTLLAPS